MRSSRLLACFDSAAPACREGNLIERAKMREKGESLENQRHLAMLRRDQHLARARRRSFP